MKKLFKQPVKRGIKKYDSIEKIATSQGDTYACGFVLDYNNSKSYHNMIVIDLSKLQGLDADWKAIQQINLLEV